MTLLILIGLMLICSGNSHEYDIFSMIFSKTEQQKFGLHKLDPSERKNLANLFSSIVQNNQLRKSALKYLKDEGWEEVEILGTRTLKMDKYSDEEEYVIAQEGVWLYILEPKYYSTLLPGTYLGDMGFISCEIIDRDGNKVEFWTKETK